MKSSPIIFCHFGFSDYLKFTLFSAKISNPHKNVILIGDNINKFIANELGIIHIDFNIYEKEYSILQFNRDFKFIAGKSHGRLDWTKFVFKRWFYVNEYVTKNNIESFWHFDSDNLIISDLSKKEEYFKLYDNTEQCGGICLNGFISSKRIVSMYILHILSLFNNQEYLTRQIEKCSLHPNFAFTEMAAYNHFKKEYNLKTVRLNAIVSDDTFDDCLACEDNMQQSSELYNGYRIKEVYINYKYKMFFKKLDENIFYKVISINLSWMPSFVISRLFYTYCRSFFPIFKLINFKRTYIKINYSHYSFLDKIIDKLIVSYLKLKL
jgi:hypothetical protein